MPLPGRDKMVYALDEVSGDGVKPATRGRAGQFVQPGRRVRVLGRPGDIAVRAYQRGGRVGRESGAGSDNVDRLVPTGGEGVPGTRRIVAGDEHEPARTQRLVQSGRATPGQGYVRGALGRQRMRLARG